LYHRFWIAPNEREVLRRAESVVAVSRFVAETAKRTLLDVPVQVIYNGVDTERFRPGGHQRRVGQPFRLLYVGAWKKLKGVDLLAPIMRGLGDGFELRYTGGAAARRDRHDMPLNMHDIGRLQGADAVIAAMQDVDAFLFPSRSEGLPLSVLEAMACGLPVVATRGSSLTEVIKNGVTGMLCQQDDVDSFANAARSLLHDRSLAIHVSCGARRDVMDRFSMLDVIDRYLNVYEAVVYHG
jgi:glycosyltransferase involved in cell wall biosynthesis